MNTISTELELQEEIKNLKKQLYAKEQHIADLTQTNNNLVAATWRERKLKDELKRINSIVEDQNKKITESINYSWNIQKTLLPPIEDFKKDFKDSFIIHNPRDVVSGDFPWYLKLGNTVYLACCDCTGHGVPGAMLSVIGHLSLQHIVCKNPGYSPDRILEELKNEVESTLKQNEGQNTNDGMELGICKIDLETGKMEFAGARRPLIVFKNGKYIKIKGSKLPIGGNKYRYEGTFENNVINLNKGDLFFLLTDGITDQLGNFPEEKIGTKRIFEEIRNCIELPMMDIKYNLLQKLKAWQHTTGQTDDMLMFGIRF